MGTKTKIQYCDHSWSGWRGCQHVHAGCEHCFAEAMSKRNPGVLGTWGEHGTRVVAAESYWRQPLRWNAAAEKASKPATVLWDLSDPFEDWQGPMLDTHGKQLHGGSLKMADVRERFFQQVVDQTPWLNWLVLTKRPENILRLWLGKVGGENYSKEGRISSRKNVWLGCSVSDQETADKLIPALSFCGLYSPVLWVSCEPLLGPIRLPHLDVLSWVVVGGESGPKARPCHVDWIRSIIRQCEDQGVACYVKQLGSNCQIWDQYADGLGGITGGGGDVRWPTTDPKGGDPSEWPENLNVREYPD